MVAEVSVVEAEARSPVGGQTWHASSTTSGDEVVTLTRQYTGRER